MKISNVYTFDSKLVTLIEKNYYLEENLNANLFV
jgi:hypothetical protein